jgi:predicted MPP superfamily phosphohydrolase
MLEKFYLLAFLLACTTPVYAQDSTVFQHTVTGDVLPWTHDRFDAAEDKFTFTVFSDLAGGERDRVFEIAIAQLAMLRPELIINVGDLIEGGSDDVNQQWRSFDKRANRAVAPVFYVGGNHDLTGELLQGI